MFGWDDIKLVKFVLPDSLTNNFATHDQELQHGSAIATSAIPASAIPTTAIPTSKVPTSIP
jgi:hypothetical protein